ncbi:MAG: sulfotransferase domain-containing protein [Bacteroidota bacterium]
MATNDKNVVWLASYPKSGNTWFRVFITNVLSKEDKPADINKLRPATIASSRALFDEATGVSSSELSPDEIDHMRPVVYRYMAKKATDLVFHKIHDAWHKLPDGEALIPPEITRAVIYFVRNPLDVAISFAHHSSVDIDKSIQMMNNPDYAFCKRTDRLHNQLRQQLSTWSRHVESWVDNSKLPLIVIRYEDMLLKPFETFEKALKFAGLQVDAEKIEQAIDFSSFEQLTSQEKKHGFKEKSPKSEAFFRKGKMGDWKETLTGEQVQKIIQEHHAVMKRFDYIPEGYPGYA